MAKDDNAEKEEDELTGGEENEAEELEREEDVYDEDVREKQQEEDEISPTEEAFMEGYDEDEKVAECARCKKPLLEMKGTVEREFKKQHYRFCSEKCAAGFKFGE